jgi:hypothetical protein
VNHHIGTGGQGIDGAGLAPTPVEQVERHLDVLHGGEGQRLHHLGGGLYRNTEPADGPCREIVLQPAPDRAAELGQMCRPVKQQAIEPLGPQRGQRLGDRGFYRRYNLSGFFRIGHLSQGTQFGHCKHGAA